MLPLLAAATAGYLFLRRKRNPKARRPHRRRRVKRNPERKNGAWAYYTTNPKHRRK